MAPDGEVPGRFAAERRCTNCAPRGVLAFGGSSFDPVLDEAMRRAYDNDHVYWIRDRWAPLGPEGEYDEEAEGGRVILIVMPGTPNSRRYQQMNQ